TDPTGHYQAIPTDGEGSEGGGWAPPDIVGGGGASGDGGGEAAGGEATDGAESWSDSLGNNTQEGSSSTVVEKVGKPPTGARPSGYRKGVTDQVQAKNNGKCIYCGEDADTNDHVRPWKEIKEGASSRSEELDRYNDVHNLEPACRSCNSSKGARDGPNPNRN
ncbi:MAG: HNH endonuclease, partial [Herpetosiphonaceae bacterium]|nr:HNH endonuclease [Herpetosiphonaceae bacterium]